MNEELMPISLSKALSKWINAAQFFGTESDITIVVSGRIIVGTLTPVERFDRWEAEQLGRVVHSDGTTSVPSTFDLPALTDEEWEQIKRQQEEMLRGDMGDNWRQELAEAVTFPIFCLRNVRVEVSGQPTDQWISFPYLAIKTDAVEAYLWGRIGSRV